jgi:hypothetical protein
MADAAEKNNLRKTRPEVFSKMKALYEKWESEVRRDRRG